MQLHSPLKSVNKLKRDIETIVLEALKQGFIIEVLR